MDTSLESLEGEDDNNMSFRKILDALMVDKELILTIRESDVPAVKRNLTSLKGRDVQKLKSAGIEPGDEVLSYASAAAKDTGGVAMRGMVDLRITLAPRKGVQVFGIKLPDPEL